MNESRIADASKESYGNIADMNAGSTGVNAFTAHRTCGTMTARTDLGEAKERLTLSPVKWLGRHRAPDDLSDVAELGPNHSDPRTCTNAERAASSASSRC